MCIACLFESSISVTSSGLPFQSHEPLSHPLQLSYLSEEQLKEKGMTQGAAKKLHLKIEELK